MKLRVVDKVGKQLWRGLESLTADGWRSTYCSLSSRISFALCSLSPSRQRLLPRVEGLS